MAEQATLMSNSRDIWNEFFHTQWSFRDKLITWKNGREIRNYGNNHR